ncbi:MAG: hypothetical protein ACI4MK_01945, partial [Aristaeellaceae bacterium]
EYLNQAKTLDQRINVKLDRVSRLRAMTQKITASLDGEQVSRTRNVTSLEDAIIRLMEEEESLNAAIDRLVDLKREVSGVLKQIDDTDCQLLLELRYLCYRSWEEIAEVMHMHIRTVYKVHGRALLKVEVILQNADFKENRKSGS